MKLILFSCVLSIFEICNAQNFDTIPANNYNIEYTGRIDFSQPLAPKFNYTGVSIRASFNSTSIYAILNDDIGNNYYNIILDGRFIDTFRVAKGKKAYKLASGLENEVHEIEIFKRTEQEFGKTQFFGFLVDKGASLTAISSKRDLLFEFIGNSITCGYGNEGKLGDKFGPTTENHYLTYAAITSRNFNARHLAVCRSGIGIYRNYGGPAEGNKETMTNYYTRVFLYDAKPLYSFSNKPDLIFIDLGTNDFSTIGGDSAKYVSNYFRLIDTIETKYSMPEIVCLVGPMMGGATLDNVRRYLTFIADSVTKKGRGKVHFFEMSAETTDLGIDYHPNVIQHKKNAQELTEYIKNLKGWKVQPQVLGANIMGINHIKIVFNTSVQDTTGKFEGFEVLVNNKKFTINSIYSDSTNNRTIHLLTQETIAVGDSIKLNYKGNNVQSTDSLNLLSFLDVNVLNGLTVTKLSKAQTSSAGKNLVLSFNKNLKKNSGLEGLTVFNKQGNLVVDSFKIANTQIILYLHEGILKGDSVFVNYAGNSISGEDQIALNEFTRFAVKNSSSYTAIKVLKNDNDAAIFPNPCKTKSFNYNLKDASFGQNAKLEVYDITGNVVFSKRISTSAGEIQLDDKLKNGMYILKFDLGNAQIHKSIVLE